MSVTVSTVQTTEVGKAGLILARYDKDLDALGIYPQGLGHGPAMYMSKADWARISREVMMAFSRADNDERFNAAEGVLSE